MRRPISLVRRATAYAIVAYRPTQAITSARIANALHSLANTISWLMVWSMSAAWVLILVTGTRSSAWCTIWRTAAT